MLMNHPEEFHRMARDWAVKYANAPKNTNWQSSAAQIPTQSRPKTQRSKEEELRRYGLFCMLWCWISANGNTDTKDIIKISLIDL
jgi:ubiquitin-conjugating enzyme (huntingtin interacting protein 2)